MATFRDLEFRLSRRLRATYSTKLVKRGKNVVRPPSGEILSGAQKIHGNGVTSDLQFDSLILITLTVNPSLYYGPRKPTSGAGIQLTRGPHVPGGTVRKWTRSSIPPQHRSKNVFGSIADIARDTIKNLTSHQPTAPVPSSYLPSISLLRTGRNRRTTPSAAVTPQRLTFPPRPPILGTLVLLTPAALLGLPIRVFAAVPPRPPRPAVDVALSAF